MTLFLSLVIFVLSVALFFVTWNKVRNIKKDILVEDTKKELEALLGEFNGAAARNIELLEAKIGELQDMMKKASGKIVELDGRIDRANRPIVIEKVVPGSSVRPQNPPPAPEQPSPAIKARQNVLQTPAPAAAPRASRLEESRNIRERLEEAKKTAARPERSKTREKPVRHAEEETAGRTPPEQTETGRSDLLKKYLREGRSREDLLSLGFQENEINLLSFFLKKHG